MYKYTQYEQFFSTHSVIVYSVKLVIFFSSEASMYLLADSSDVLILHIITPD